MTISLVDYRIRILDRAGREDQRAHNTDTTAHGALQARAREALLRQIYTELASVSIVQVRSEIERDLLTALKECEPYLTTFQNDVAGEEQHDPSLVAALELLRRQVRDAIAKAEQG